MLCLQAEKAVNQSKSLLNALKGYNRSPQVDVYRWTTRDKRVLKARTCWTWLVSINSTICAINCLIYIDSPCHLSSNKLALLLPLHSFLLIPTASASLSGTHLARESLSQVAKHARLQSAFPNKQRSFVCLFRQKQALFAAITPHNGTSEVVRWEEYLGARPIRAGFSAAEFAIKIRKDAFRSYKSSYLWHQNSFSFMTAMLKQLAYFHLTKFERVFHRVCLWVSFCKPFMYI